MRTTASTALLVSLLLSLTVCVTGCQGTTGTRRTTSTGSDLSAYCDVARAPGLDAWIGDVVTTCAPGEDEETATCRAMRARADGRLDPIALSEGASVLRAMPAGARIVALLADERLVIDERGALRELAPWASDPWIDEHGERVVFVGLADGVEFYEPGAPTVIRSLDLETGATTLISDDPEASSPRTIPGTRDVLFVSTRSGTASVWLAREGAAPEAITAGEDGDAIPAPDRELAFVGSTIVYTTEDERGARLWALDVTTREAREIGPGRWPRPDGSGSVIALQDGVDGDCAATFPVAGGAR